MPVVLSLNLPPELHTRLGDEARLRGMGVEDYTMQLLKTHLPPEPQGAQIAALLQSWIDEESAQEQTDTGQFLVKALDEDRPSDRKLYPPELKGISW